MRALQKQIGFANRAVKLAEVRYQQAESSARQRQEELKQGIASQVVVDGALAMQEIYSLNLLNYRLDLLSRWSEFLSLVEGDPALQFLPPNLKSNVR